MMSFWKKIAPLLKRASDLLLAGGALLLLSPVTPVIALAIKLDDRGPVLFVQDRVGRGRRKFRCYKFRTMIVDAETQGSGLTVVADDPRITRVGRVLRLWGLDELPQLLNVVKGDMSIVGPRPWVPSHAAFCRPHESRRFDLRPGMAGWAWIHGRNSLSWRERIRLDLWYVDHWSLRLDLYILARAFLLLLRRDGLYVRQTREVPATHQRTGVRVQRRAMANYRVNGALENAHAQKFLFPRGSGESAPGLWTPQRE